MSYLNSIGNFPKQSIYNRNSLSNKISRDRERETNKDILVSCLMRLKNKRANIRMSARHCTAAVEKRSRQVILYQGLTLWLADVSIERINEGKSIEGYIHQIGEKDVELRCFSKSPIHDTAASPVATHIGQRGELSLSVQSINECMPACLYKRNDAFPLLGSEKSSGSKWFSHSLSFSPRTSTLDRSPFSFTRRVSSFFCITREQSFVHLEETSISNNEFRTAFLRK